MNTDALVKDLAGLKKDLRQVSDDISAGHKELKSLERSIELARMELKNVQTMNDPLVQNYDLRISQKKKELVLLEADIAAAVLTKQDIDEAMAERLFTGQQAIDNAQKVEHSIKESIKNLRHREEAQLQTIRNIKAQQDTESCALVTLKESVVSLKQQDDMLRALVAEKQMTREQQKELEKKEKQLNDGRDNLTSWEKEVKAYEHDLKVMEARLKPAYLKAFADINSRFINENSYTRRKTV
jgi:chromosome segregation ATPase